MGASVQLDHSRRQSDPPSVESIQLTSRHLMVVEYEVTALRVPKKITIQKLTESGSVLFEEAIRLKDQHSFTPQSSRILNGFVDGMKTGECVRPLAKLATLRESLEESAPSEFVYSAYSHKLGIDLTFAARRSSIAQDFRAPEDRFDELTGLPTTAWFLRNVQRLVTERNGKTVMGKVDVIGAGAVDQAGQGELLESHMQKLPGWFHRTVLNSEAEGNPIMGRLGDEFNLMVGLSQRIARAISFVTEKFLREAQLANFPIGNPAHDLNFEQAIQTVLRKKGFENAQTAPDGLLPLGTYTAFVEFPGNNQFTQNGAPRTLEEWQLLYCACDDYLDWRINAQKRSVGTRENPVDGTEILQLPPTWQMKQGYQITIGAVNDAAEEYLHCLEGFRQAESNSERNYWAIELARVSNRHSTLPGEILRAGRCGDTTGFDLWGPVQGGEYTIGYVDVPFKDWNALLGPLGADQRIILPLCQIVQRFCPNVIPFWTRGGEFAFTKPGIINESDWQDALHAVAQHLHEEKCRIISLRMNSLQAKEGALTKKDAKVLEYLESVARGEEVGSFKHQLLRPRSISDTAPIGRAVLDITKNVTPQLKNGRTVQLDPLHRQGIGLEDLL